MGCYVQGDKNSMGCYVRGDKNCMGCFVPGGKSLWDVLSGASKKGMVCFPGMFCPAPIYDRHRCQTIARYKGNFSPHLKVKLEFTLVLLNPELTLVLLNLLLKTLDPDQLVISEITGSTLFSTPI